MPRAPRSGVPRRMLYTFRKEDPANIDQSARGQVLSFAAICASVRGPSLYGSSRAQERQGANVRVARIDSDPSHLEAYKVALSEEIEAAVRLELGVPAFYAFSERDEPTRIRIFEVYATEEAHTAHLQTLHFLRCKAGTEHMVRLTPPMPSRQAQRRVPVCLLPRISRTAAFRSLFRGELQFWTVEMGAKPSVLVVGQHCSLVRRTRPSLAIVANTPALHFRHDVHQLSCVAWRKSLVLLRISGFLGGQSYVPRRGAAFRPLIPFPNG